MFTVAEEDDMADPGRAKHPVTRLAGPYGHPLHPALVPVPIGAWIAALVFDVASHAGSSQGFLADGARWLVAIGIVGALAAATAGVLDLAAIPPRTHAMRLAVTHMSVNLTATALFAAGLLLRWGDGAGPVGYGVLALDALGVAALATGGFLGGELAYRFGVRVADEATQAAGFRTAPTDPAGAPAPANERR